MSKIILMALCLFFSSCENSYSERNFPAKPKELEDCKIFYLTNDAGESITVVRCQNSNTTTTYRVSAGKSSREETVAVID